MKSKFFILATVLFVNSSLVQGAPQIICHDTDTFVPLKFTLVDDDRSGPVLKFDGLHLGQVMARLGLRPPTGLAFEDRDLTITLPGQPKKSILPSDPRVRHYTSFDLKGPAIAQFRHKNQLMQKEVLFQGLEIIKHVTASRGVAYGIGLRLQHSGKNWNYSKPYYSHSCR